MVQVVAALIRDGEKFMIFQRPSNKTRAYQWEFVGGKAEPGEPLDEALIRECREELAVTVKPDSIFTQLIHEYPDITIRLTLFNAKITDGIPQMREHHDIKWIFPSQIPEFDFCPADTEILARLMEG